MVMLFLCAPTCGHLLPALPLNGPLARFSCLTEIFFCGSAFESLNIVCLNNVSLRLLFGACVLQVALETQVTADVPTGANECSVMLQEHKNGKDCRVPLETWLLVHTR